jgi:hypothetical protein
MDLGFALQARCLEAVAAGSVDASSCVVPVPASIDAAVANSYLDRKYAGHAAATAAGQPSSGHTGAEHAPSARGTADQRGPFTER